MELKSTVMSYHELTVLIPSHGLEDFPTELSEKPAASLLNAFAVIWHPALLAGQGALPRWRRADDPPEATTGSLIILPTACDDHIPNGWVTLARQAGATVISGVFDRKEMLAQALAPLKLEFTPDEDLSADFLAFGSVYLQLELLTRRMRNYSNFDEHRLQQVSVAAAKAAMDDDPEGARKHLRTCFEMLLESRERFYPVECFLMDLCLVTPETWPDDATSLLNGGGPINALASAADWKRLLERHPSLQNTLKEAVDRQQFEFIGGDDVELISSLRSLDDTVWHLQKGNQWLKDQFGSRAQVWARRRFGLHSQIPQVLKRLGYLGAMHTLLDDGIAPEDEQSHMSWEGSDGSAIDSFSRIPLPGDGARNMLRFSERLAESMDYDHSAAVVFARWPQLKTPFFEDLRRMQKYAPVLGQFVRFSDYFSQVSSPGRRGEFKASSYFSPSLIQAVAASEKQPISRHLDYWKRERQFTRAEWISTVTSSISGKPVSTNDLQTLEQLEEKLRSEGTGSESGQLNEFDAGISEFIHATVENFQNIVTAGGVPGNGVLIINTHSFPRKAVIDWPLKESPPTDPPVLGIQVDADRTRVLVSLPPCGFVWLAAGEAVRTPTAPGKIPMAEELVVRNDLLEVRMSETTGGIAQIMTYRRSPNRLSQQVAIRFPHEKTFTVGEGDKQESYSTYYTAMRRRESRVLSAGPLVGEIGTMGDLVDEQTEQVLGTYRQWTRLTHGRGVVEVDLEISLAQELSGNPWTSYAGCRFAWKHEDVALSGSYQQGAHLTGKERIESPQFLEIADEQFRTTILTPGLPFHRKTGERMLDTLLVVEGEATRHFQFAIAVDAVYPMQAHLDQFSAPVVVKTSTKPANGKREGWFFSLSAANVQMQRIQPGSQPGALKVRLLETEGRRRVVELNCFRTPKVARQVDFQGNVIQILKITENEAVQIEVSGHEICDVELEF